MRPMALVPLVSLALLAAATAAAAEDKAAARAHFEAGRRLYDVGEFAPALASFKAAYVAKDDPVFLFNIAQCHRKLGQVDEAITFYERFLQRAPAGDPRREWVEARLRRAQDEVVFRRDLEPGDSATAAPVDDDPFAAPSPVEPFAAAAPSAAQSAAPPVALVGAPAPALTPGPVASRLELSKPAPRDDGKGLRIAGIAAAAVGVAAVATAIYFYGRARHYSDIVSTNPNHTQADLDAGHRAETMQWIGYTVGAAALAGGAVLYWRGMAARPLAGPGLAGLSVGGAF